MNDNHERNENYPHDPEIYKTLMTDRSERRQTGRTRLYVSWEREVLPEGVTLEAVVGQDATEVGVVGEEHAEHVPHLCSAHTLSVLMSPLGNKLQTSFRAGLTSLSYQLAAIWTGTAESTGVNSSVYVLTRIREL